MACGPPLLVENMSSGFVLTPPARHLSPNELAFDRLPLDRPFAEGDRLSNPNHNISPRPPNRITLPVSILANGRELTAIDGFSGRFRR